ncbi:hypothetical protein FH968_22355 [Buttiauxella sp. B2]|uniref:hypothetical protein n=1 Tax=Buttiauxella sp. B2 TaxID=2587812 RepID=UPI00111CAAAE|nr:hypothetical protein [Buttiauxella sp. B2]TNV11616.1 hypothetical protein FH968_22355 [Buttiauxella sp. B2]
MDNNVLKEYLDYYLKLDAPEYAVLVTGDWGVGKTHQVFQIIPEAIRCHVSLFGISNTNEIYASVFATMFPTRSKIKNAAEKTKDASAEINGITFGAGAILGSVVEAFIKERVDKDKIIIFDDLERCPLKNEEILGVINKYVEHHKCRVLVLAHDNKTHEDFISTKEKIIGHTIKITPQIDDAAISFFNETVQLNNFNIVKSVIIDSFKKTKCQSLRVLKHVIKDCERLRRCLNITHIKNIDAMRLLFSNFTIINVEYRLGNITKVDIESINEEYREYTFSGEGLNDIELSPEQKRRVLFYNKYNEQDILTNILDYEFLSELMESGSYQKEKIIASINSSKYFMTERETPSWLKIMRFDRLENEIINEAILNLQREFETHTITEIGEMLHSIHVSFLMSKNGIIDKGFHELCEYFKKYINDLLRLNKLPPIPLNGSFFDEDILDHSHGHGYWRDKEYNEYIEDIKNHLQKKRSEALLNQYESFKDEILAALSGNVIEFKRLFLGDGTDTGKYSQIDILTSIPVEEFVINWFMLPLQDLDKVRMVLNSRYRGHAVPALKNEKSWMNELCVTLKLEAQTSTGFEQLRIERLTPYSGLKYV